MKMVQMTYRLYYDMCMSFRKIILKLTLEVGYEGVTWIQVVQDWDQ